MNFFELKFSSVYFFKSAMKQGNSNDYEAIKLVDNFLSQTLRIIVLVINLADRISHKKKNILQAVNIKLNEKVYGLLSEWAGHRRDMCDINLCLLKRRAINPIFELIQCFICSSAIAPLFSLLVLTVLLTKEGQLFCLN